MALTVEHKLVVSQNEAFDLVGGRPVWDALKATYPSILIPLRIVGKKEQYLKETIITVLRGAQMDGKLRKNEDTK